MKIVMGLALTASLVAFGGARAQTPNELVYDWTLTGPTTGAGTITVNDYGDPNLGLDILAIGGTFDGAAINGLLGTNGFQYSPSGQFQIDNLLYTNYASAYLDVYGVLFSTDAYQEVNIWGNGGGDYAADQQAGRGGRGAQLRGGQPSQRSRALCISAARLDPRRWRRPIAACRRALLRGDRAGVHACPARGCRLRGPRAAQPIQRALRDAQWS